MGWLLGLIFVGLAGLGVANRVQKKRWVQAAAFAGVVLAAGALWWLIWGLWINQQPHGSPAPDHWYAFMTGVGAAAAASAAIIGGIIAARYGRKATVSLTADAVKAPRGVIVRVRPSVQAVGIFRLRFKENRGAVLTMTEVWADDTGELNDGRFWDQDAVFGPSFVEGGETLTTTVVFPMLVIPERVVGWRVSIAIVVPQRRLIPADSWTWADRVFVGRPDVGNA